MPHIQSIAAIPQIIEKSIYIESQPNNDTDTNPDVTEYQCYVCGLNIGGEEYTVLAKVAVDKNGNRYYDHNLTAVAKGKLIDIANNEQSAVTSGFGTTPDTESTTNSQRKYNELISILQTNSSKIVDANGEPRVVYHGTNADFWAFNPDAHHTHDKGYYGKGIYFTFGDFAPEYEALSYGDRVIDAFVNIRKPFDFSQLMMYNGVGINSSGGSTLAFYYNMAKNFPELEGIVELPTRYKMENDTKKVLSPLSYKEFVKLTDDISSKLRISRYDDIRGNQVYDVDYVTGEVEELSGVQYPVVKTMMRGVRGDKEQSSVASSVFTALENVFGFDPEFHPEGVMTRNPEITQAIKDRGFDGILQSATGDELLVFNPNQIKSAKENIGTYDANNPDIRFSLREPIFYSNTEYAVRGIKQEKATPEQWLKMIEKSGGLKAGEDKWLGLSVWLKASDKKTLTKDDVLQYIAENDIQIDEESYVEFGPGLIDEATRKLEAEMREIGIDAMREKYDGFDDLFEVYNGELVWSESRASEGEYEDFIIGNKVIDVDASAKAINETRTRYTTQGLNRKREIALTVPTIEPWNTSDNIHFGDAGEGRAVAWVRFGETTDAEGKRVLVIDEIQSKRHQEGRKKGYSNKRVSQQELYDAQEEAFSKVIDYESALADKYGEDEWASLASEEEMAEYERLRAIDEAATNAYENYDKGIPAAPFEKNWAELAMKRMLRYAAENGFDKVAWIMGDQQCERYNIGTKIERIEKTDDYSFDVHPVNSGYLTLDFDEDWIYRDEDDRELNNKHISEIFGKDIAKRLQEMPVEEELSGDGLRIGGEGMKAFYDQMLPSFVRKYAKKWGATVGEVTMPDLEENNTMHSVDVTPAMRESVMQGQPKFSLREVNDRFNEELAALTEENARERILNIGIPSPVLLACGIENKPIRLYGAKLLSKVRKHGYNIGDLKNLPLAISEPIAVFKGSMSNSFAILTELLIEDNNVLATLSVGRGGHDVDFNIISLVYDKRGDSVVRWVNDGKLLYVDKEKALDYFSVSAPLAEAQNNQELISTTKVIQNFENPKIEPRFSLIGELGAANLDKAEEATKRLDNLAVARDMETAGKDAKTIKLATGWERGADGKWRYEIDDAVINQNAIFNHRDDGVSITLLGELLTGGELLKAYPQLDDMVVVYQELPLGTLGGYSPANKLGMPANIVLSDMFLARRENPEWRAEVERMEQEPIIKAWSDAMTAEPYDNNAYESAEQAFKASPLWEEYNNLLMGKGKYPRLIKGIGGREALLHEVQHAIQDIEGFAMGGNTKSEGYNRLAGEVEARNIEKRANMTTQERLASLAEETEDVAREDQIILREGAKMAMGAKKKSAEETASPNNSDHPAAISSADGAKILKNIDNLARKYQEKSNRPDTFIGDVADALGIDMPNKSSKYRTYETISGDIVTIRLSNHGTTASKLDANNETNAVSIVIANSYDGITNDGEAHIVEYFYDAIKLRKADGKPLVGIINSLKQTLYSGKYVDNTGIAEVKEVNARFSLRELDAPYLEAVERGDMATAQRMVLEAAKLAMPDTKIVDANGAPKVVYHQTNATEYVNVETGELWDDLDWMKRAEWDERDDWDEHWQERDFYTFSRANARTTQEFDGFFFAPEYDEYHEYGDRTISAFLNIKNPASRTDYNIDSSKNNAGQEERLRLQREGYDGVINEVDGVVWEYVAFEPNQIKSADPVTYDDNGNVIPLSERFNPEKEDMRYSLKVMQDTANALTAYENTNNADALIGAIKTISEEKSNRNLFYSLMDSGSGTYNLLEIYSDRKGNLSAKTYYKTKKDAAQRVMELNKTLLPTSETYSGAILSGTKIPQIFELPKVKTRNSLRGTDKSLVGIHNLSLDKLRKVIKMGGLANPSVAVIDVDKQTHDDYGEYSLILPNNMVDARKGRNAGTWAGDAWTPTYPTVIKRMTNDKAISRFYKDIDALPEVMRSRVKLDFDSFMEGRSANALAYWYLFEKGVAPELVLIPSQYSDDIASAIEEATNGSFSMYGLTPEERAKCLDAYIAAKYDGNRAAFEAEMQSRIDRLTETLETKKSDRVKKWAQETIDSIREYGFDYDDVAKFIRDVEYDVRKKGTVDVETTITNAREQITTDNLEADYDAWRNNLDERYGIGVVICF